MSLTYKVLIIAGITLFVAIRSLSPMAAKGFISKRWQLWALGDRHGKSPRRDDVVM